MPNQNIFCNVPWTNLHIYWDGSYGICCNEQNKPYNKNETVYNLENFTVAEWYNQLPIRSIRQQMHNSQTLSACAGCYNEEEQKYESRRIKENFKSVIFTEKNFYKSYIQSPGNKWFEESKDTGNTSLLPIDWHIDLGNECNLACKMCAPKASSKIAAQYKKWNLIQTVENTNWTLNEKAWSNFLISIDQVKNLNRLHFMGGEVLLSKKFYKLIDYLLEIKRTDISISFVTNGTILDKSLIQKLQNFKSFNIEVSIESITSNNSYIRQGADTNKVLENIKYLQSQQSEKFQLVLRSVPQLLNVNNYHQYILWAWQEKLSIQGIPLINPKYLQIQVLPKSIKNNLINLYKSAIEQIQNSKINNFTTIATGRDISRLDIQLIRECNSIINFLNSPESPDVEQLRFELVEWLMRWDKIYNYNALDQYPEYEEFLSNYGYKV